MKNRVDRNRVSAARIARALDDAAVRVDDATLLVRLGRLRNLALDSRTDNPAAPRTDRRTLAACRRLNQRLADGAALWELLAPLGEIERGLFDRERRPGDESPLYEQKRRLFDRLRALAAEIDGLSLRRRQLVAEGAEPVDESFDPSGALRREEFDACGRRLRHLQNAYRQTSAALRAMDSVQLLHSEEVMLQSLEDDCASLPDADAAERRQLRLELREEALARRTEAIVQLRSDPAQPVDKETDGMAISNTVRSASDETDVTAVLGPERPISAIPARSVDEEPDGTAIHNTMRLAHKEADGATFTSPARPISGIPVHPVDEELDGMTVPNTMRLADKEADVTTVPGPVRPISGIPARPVNEEMDGTAVPNTMRSTGKKLDVTAGPDLERPISGTPARPVNKETDRTAIPKTVRSAGKETASPDPIWPVREATAPRNAAAVRNIPIPRPSGGGERFVRMLEEAAEKNSPENS